MTTRRQDIDDEADALRSWSRQQASEADPVAWWLIKQIAIGVSLAVIAVVAIVFSLLLIAPNL